jgi:hypothetical protein
MNLDQYIRKYYNMSRPPNPGHNQWLNFSDFDLRVFVRLSVFRRIDGKLRRLLEISSVEIHCKPPHLVGGSAAREQSSVGCPSDIREQKFVRPPDGKDAFARFVVYIEGTAAKYGLDGIFFEKISLELHMFLLDHGYKTFGPSTLPFTDTFCFVKLIE